VSPFDSAFCGGSEHPPIDSSSLNVYRGCARAVGAGQGREVDTQASRVGGFGRPPGAWALRARPLWPSPPPAGSVAHRRV